MMMMMMNEVNHFRTVCRVMYITGCAVALGRQPSVNGDWLSQWEMAIFDPLQNRHPLTDRQIICHR